MDEFDPHWDEHPEQVTVHHLNNIAGKFPGGYERSVFTEKRYTMPLSQAYAGSPYTYSELFLSLTRKDFHALIDQVALEEGWQIGDIVSGSNVTQLPSEQQEIIMKTYRRLRAMGFMHYELIA